MKIFLTLEYPFHKFGYGGGSQILLGLAEGLADVGHEIYIITSGVDEVGAAIKLPQCKFYGTVISYGRFLLNPTIVGLFTIFLLLVNRPKVVIGFGGESFFVSIACRLLNIQFYSFLAAPNLPEFSQLVNRRSNGNLYLQYLATTFATSVFTLSNYLSNQAINLWNIRRDKVVTIGGGISNIFLDKKTQPWSSHSLNGTFKLATVGRIAFNQKPLNILCETIHKLGDRVSSWSVIGSGQDLLSLKAQVKKLGLDQKVKFLGTLDSIEIKNQLLMSDIIVLPSTHESMMLTAYEAISQNRITLVNDVADLHHNFQGYDSVVFFEDISINSFFNGINYSMDNFQRLSQESTKAATFVKSRMNWSSCARKINREISKATYVN